jgi:cell division protein FtsB
LKIIKKKFFKALLLGLFFVLLVVSWLAFGNRGFIYLYKMDKEREEYLERIQKLELANKELEEEIDRLTNDREYIESTVRKELNFVKKDEVIYRFTEDDK